jgi:hypothetical protein
VHAIVFVGKREISKKFDSVETFLWNRVGSDSLDKFLRTLILETKQGL